MDNIREWASAVCCACVLGAMLSMVFPDGSSKRLLGMIVSLMMLCVLLKPFTAARDFALDVKNYSFEAEQYENPVLEAEVESNAKSIYSSYLEQNLRRVLDGSNISYLRVEAIMDNSEDGCISIGQVEVIVKNEDVDKSDRIKELLRDYIGFEPVVREAQ